MFTIKINVLRQELRDSETKEMKFKGALNHALSFYVMSADNEIMQIIPWRNRGVGILRKTINRIKSVDRANSILISNGYWDWSILVYEK